MQRILFSVLMTWTSLCQSEDTPSNPLDIDDKGSLAKALQHAIKGKWSELFNKSLPFAEFTQKKGLQYPLSGENPYSGWYGQWDDKGQLRNLHHFSEGMSDGPVFSWHENGNKLHQGYYKRGRKHGNFVFWSKNLSKIREQNFKEGKLDGVCTGWYENGNKSSLKTFKEGKILSAIGWKPNGKRCPTTEVLDGVGVVIFYAEDSPSTNEPERIESKPEPEDAFVIEKYENGNKREEGSYRNGQKIGLWIYYRTDGTEFFRRTYPRGVKPVIE